MLAALPADLFLFQFILLFARLGTTFMVFPIFSDPAISARIRLLLALLISLAFMPMLHSSLPSLPATTSGTLFVLGSEIIIGILLGLAGRLLYSALMLAGELVAFMGGFQSATLFDPASGANTAAPSILLSLSASMMFLALNLHHVFILGLAQSYQVFPAGELPPVGDTAMAVTNIITQAFILGTQLAAPVIVSGFLALAMFGVFNRLIPQLQVFFVSVPISIALSLLVLGVTVSLVLTQFTDTLASHLFITEYSETSF
jgi:flagellar biosynthetic protein FliR